MRLSVVTYGSEGDTRPFVALSRSLIDSGHHVQLFAEQSSCHIASAHRVPVEALGGDIKATLPISNPRQELRTADVIRTVKRGLRGINGSIESWMEAISAHSRTADAILCAGLAYPTAEAVAQALNKPAIGLWLQPTTPTREFGSSSLPPWRMPGWLNRLSYWASPEAMIRRLYGKATEIARRRLFGGVRNGLTNVQIPILYGFSRHIVARPADWPGRHQICGYWQLPASSDWEPSSRLREFLSNGSPPIYVGFGATSSFVRAKGLNEIVTAIEGRRALFYPGWSDITSEMLPSNFHVLEDTPHAWLFPRTSMVIHHGGAGTTHSACCAGVPSVVLPFGGDQPFWASRLANIGVSPPYVRRGKWDHRSLKQMIQFCEQDSVRARAEALGLAMVSEDGIGNAVRAIEEILISAKTSALVD